MNKMKERVKVRKKLGKASVISAEEYESFSVDSKLEIIRALIPLGLTELSRQLDAEVTALAGPRHSREGEYSRFGSNPGSVKLGGQRQPIRVPRLRHREQGEKPLETWQSMQQDEDGEVNEGLLKRVLYGISCRDYEAATDAIPGAIGLSKSSVSREFKEASRAQLKAFQERSLAELDVVALLIDGKSFGNDLMVIVLGVTLDGRKIPLGFAQSATENENAMSQLLLGLIDRGLRTEQGLLVIVDGSKGLRSAIKRVLGRSALVQRCQWHKRENVVSYLAKNEQAWWRKRLQQAYERPTYEEAKKALLALQKELADINQSAATSLEEGLEETLTLHRLKLFSVLGKSLKTTNALESLNALIELRCGRVTRWVNSDQRARWLATALLDAEPRMKRIRDHERLPKLREALIRELNLSESAGIENT